MTADSCSSRSENAVEIFSRYRPLLFSVAYRMLGSVAEAEDAIQETFLRWQAVPIEEVRSPKSYLVSVLTRLCIDQLRSAKDRCEVYVGPWLPEPVVTATAAAAGTIGGMEGMPEILDSVELAESITMAFLLLMESLSPIERAVFLLHDVFSYEYDEIASMVNKSEANCRQMVARARRHLREGQPRFQVADKRHTEIADKFLQVCLGGDMNGLLAMLTDGAVLVTDGGGKVQAARNPIQGADKVARAMLGVIAKTLKLAPTATFRTSLTEINGQVGCIIYMNEAPYSVFTLEFDSERISRLNFVVNPDKLRHLT